jgi:hypothetical protein
MKKWLCFNFILLLLGCSNRNDIYKDINELYYRTFDVEKNKDYGTDYWYEQNNAFSDMLLSYFRTKDSLEMENIHKLIFLNYSFSEDDLIRIFSWNTSLNNPNETFNTLVQYKKYEKYYSLLLREKIVSPIFFDHPAFDHEFYKIINLGQKVYLLIGQTTKDDVKEYSFVTIYFKEGDMIIPYYSFKNIYSELEKDMSMVFFSDSSERINNIKTSFENNEFKIMIIYDTDKNIDFIFDGINFVGDYKKLQEVIRRP